MKTFISIITMFLILGFGANTFAFNDEKSFATGESYFDVITGHRYIKNADNTYREYNRKGELFRSSVSANQPHLTNRKYVMEIGRGCYVMYEKRDNNVMKTQILPASSDHPEGWYAKNSLVCVRNMALLKKAGLDSPVKSYAFSNDKRRLVATGESYFDIITGHRYVKNADNTYREYSKRGELFRSSVSANQPHLTNRKYVMEIGRSCYLLYQRKFDQKTQLMALRHDQRHPEGWESEKLLISMK